MVEEICKNYSKHPILFNFLKYLNYKIPYKELYYL